jgi:hypothetical protein
VPSNVQLNDPAMRFSAHCLHCSRVVLTDAPQLGGREVRALRHHLLVGCRAGDVTDDDFGRLAQHYRITMADGPQ